MQVKELITKKNPDLLDSFLDVSCIHVYCIRIYTDVLYICPCMYNCVHIFFYYHLQEVIAFQQDSAPDVRKFVVNFMEDAW